MSFRFSLATVLRVRGMAEEREERMLQRIVQELGQTRLGMEQVEASILRRNDAAALRGRGMDVHAAYAEWTELQARREELAGQLVKLDELRGMQMQKYAAARREREMLTEMCEAKRGAYEAQASRREQSSVDENFMAQRLRA